MSSLCQRCQQGKATVHITDTMPEKRERHLCEDCAEKEGVIIKQHPTTNEIIQQFIKQKTGLGVADDLSCSRCGMTFRQFHAKGQLGCPDDYQAFKKALGPLIERAHEGATHHIGKIPATADEAVRKQAGLLRLRRELQEAVEQENYERAARVRDQIQALESG
jgi:protein arginine kinase activator